MAQRKTASKSSSSKKTSTRSKSSGSRSARKKPNTRLILTLTFLALGIFTLIGYFTTDGVVTNLLHVLMTGLFGGGFYLLPPAFLFCAGLYALSDEKPATLRIVSVMLVPLLLGGWFQLFSRNQYDLAIDSLGKLYADGVAGIGGGAVSGYFTTLLMKLFSRAGAFIFEFILSAAVVIGATGIPSEVLGAKLREKRNDVRKWREVRAAMAEEPEPAPEKPRTNKAQIDVPMDGDTAAAAESLRSRNKGSLFNRQSNVKAPDELFSQQEKPAEKPEPAAQPEKPEPSAAVPAEQPASESADAELDVPSFVEATLKPVPPKSPRRPAVSAPEPIRVDREEAQSFAALIDENVKRDLEQGLRNYVMPSTSLLTPPKQEKSDAMTELNKTKDRLELILNSFGINSRINNIINGPSITRYEMELEIGVKLNKLTSLSNDIALQLGVPVVRVAAIPDKISTVGIEVPNKNVSTVWLRDVFESKEFRNARSKLSFALGKNIGGEVMVGSIDKLPHMLIAGTTGSGKSVFMNAIILSILFKATPDEVKFIMIDPKRVEFILYNGIPHLLVPVVVDTNKAAGALQWAVVEMMKRYTLFSEAGSRDISTYNENLKRNGEPTMPFIVIVIDELADLMMAAAKEVEESICRIAQMGRAAGIHLLIATQSPRADIITGLMKANIPSRVSFRVASALESRIVLDQGGSAEMLVGHGDMLYAPIGTQKPIRIQGAWVSDDDREKVVEFIKQSGEAKYSEDAINGIELASQGKDARKASPQPAEEKGDYDELVPQAAEVIFETQQASTSMLQRKLKLGYARAARLIDQLEELGILGPFEGSKPRQILITREQWLQMQYINGTAPIPPAEQLSFDGADNAGAAPEG